MQKRQKNNIKQIVSKSIDGKLPPQAIELEEAVLGALMIDNDALSNAIELLKPDSFYKHQHQKIFSAIEDLFNHQSCIICSKIVAINQKKESIHQNQPDPLLKWILKHRVIFWVTFLSGIAGAGAYFVKKITNEL